MQRDTSHISNGDHFIRHLSTSHSVHLFEHALHILLAHKAQHHRLCAYPQTANIPRRSSNADEFERDIILSAVIYPQTRILALHSNTTETLGAYRECPSSSSYSLLTPHRSHRECGTVHLIR